MLPTWQLQSPIDAIIFDCDGTLSSIEGIDELARNNGVSDSVEALTADAMNHTGIYPELYQKRLELTLPRQQQVIDLGLMYYQHLTSDAQQVIQIFNRLEKSVFIVSAGLAASVIRFGELLGVPSKNIFAVNIIFDENGQYLDFDRTSPLTYTKGKRDIVAQLQLEYPNMIFVGDGLNDLPAMDLVTRFVGYGGIFYRENIAARCHYYIKAASMSPLLPLTLTAKEASQLTPNEQQVYQKGVSLIMQQKVSIKE